MMMMRLLLLFFLSLRPAYAQDGGRSCPSTSSSSCSSVYIDDGRSRPEMSLEELGKKTSAKEIKYMRSGPSPRNSHGASMGVKFRNFRRSKLELRWDDGTKEGTYSGVVNAMGRTATMTYQSHRFLFLEPKTRENVASFTMTAGQHLYVIEPASDDLETKRSKMYLDTMEELKFMRDYEDRTGSPWLSYYPRSPPILNLWPAENIGQTHVVASEFGYATNATTSNFAELPPLSLRLVAVSKPPQGPRVFLVEDLLSDFECDHILALGKTVVKQSMVGQGGGFQSKTRTSANGWLRRQASPILDHVYKRFGDVLGIDEKLLVPGRNAEELQVVRYDPNQEYAPHHDFGDDGTPEQRFLTLLLYLEPAESGGATSFPKAFDNRGLQIVPSRGDAVLFYSMLPDGNADDKSLHAGMPVLKGQKWVCNLWVWDPKR